MDMTITEKILARGADKTHVSPEEFVNVGIDLALTHDVLCGPAAKEFRLLASKVWNPEKIVVTPDHFIPAKDVESARLYKEMQDFVIEQNIQNYFPVGRHGICHVILPEEGLVHPGSILVGTDSHTCTHGALGAFATGIGTTEMAAVFATGESWFRVPDSMKFYISGKLPELVTAKDVILQIIKEIGVDGALYRAMEFAGPVVSDFEMDERFVLCNMAIEAGAKNGIIEVDTRTQNYLEQRGVKKFKSIESDKGAEYVDEIDMDVSDLEPTVATPFLPSNGRPARDLSNIEIDQAFVGSCTGGRLSDLRDAAKLLRGRIVSERVRLIVIPATQEIYLKALEEGLIETFIRSGAVVSTPTCGPCLGGHMGVLAENEVAIATTNRNFRGRMGHPTSEVYLASALTTAASAVEGRITDPRDIT
ncbi:MAG: 3-isopropylmalate dehydratase large subunit [Candidatus Thorarchaeota archaeon]|nr:MAG: 3-isopropylmalate dehydratase large subunit [Candidatus Thorarchaeota archaeon]